MEECRECQEDGDQEDDLNSLTYNFHSIPPPGSHEDDDYSLVGDLNIINESVKGEEGELYIAPKIRIMTIDSPPSSPLRGIRDNYVHLGSRWSKSPKLAPLILSSEISSLGVGGILGKSISTTSFTTDIPHQQETFLLEATERNRLPKAYCEEMDDETIGSGTDLRLGSANLPLRQTSIRFKENYGKIQRNVQQQESRKWKQRDRNQARQVNQRQNKTAEEDVKEKSFAPWKLAPQPFSVPPSISIVGQIGEESNILRPYFRGRGFKSNKSSRADLVFASARFEVPRKLYAKPRGFNGGEMFSIIQNKYSELEIAFLNHSSSSLPLPFSANASSPLFQRESRLRGTSPGLSSGSKIESLKFIERAAKKKFSVLTIRSGATKTTGI